MGLTTDPCASSVTRRAIGRRELRSSSIVVGFSRFPHGVVTLPGLHSNHVHRTKADRLMAAPVEQVGVIVACPACGTDVMQKTMIPLGVTDGIISYVCVPCARKLVMTGSPQP